MKEVTEWDGKPRWMWVWDRNENEKHKEYVVHIISKEEMLRVHLSCLTFPVISVVSNFSHCAEIEEEKTQLNNYELSQLFKCFGVECKQKGSTFINEALYYRCGEEKEMPAFEEIKIRYKQGEWEEPTRETVLKWCGDELYSNDIERFVEFIGWDKE